MFWIFFLTFLIVVALGWGVVFLCALAVFRALAPASAERKNIIRAAQRTALVIPVNLVLDFVVACLQESLYTLGILSWLLVVCTTPFVAYFSIRRYARFSRGRSFCAAGLLEVLIVVILLAF